METKFVPIAEEKRRRFEAAQSKIMRLTEGMPSWTVVEIANRLGISKQALHLIKSGRHDQIGFRAIEKVIHTDFPMPAEEGE